MRRTPGLEASIIDNDQVEIDAMGDSGDKRSFRARAAGPGALLVAKLHKIGERSENPTRLQDKDAHDLYRLLVAVQSWRSSSSGGPTPSCWPARATSTRIAISRR